ncbi:MAG: hypothetical protein AAF703_03225 [Cyanobacteria bacterium P01_D01_bin.105]
MNTQPTSTASGVTTTGITTPIAQRVSLVLLLTRISIFIAMSIWVLDKFVKPEHTAAVFESFYGIGGISTAVSYFLGTLQLAIMLAFLVGFKKKLSYGLVLLMHTASTLVSFPKYIALLRGQTSCSMHPGQCWRLVLCCITSEISIREEPSETTLSKRRWPSLFKMNRHPV